VKGKHPGNTQRQNGETLFFCQKGEIFFEKYRGKGRMAKRHFQFANLPFAFLTVYLCGQKQAGFETMAF
jgi:hypothetical protein